MSDRDGNGPRKRSPRPDENESINVEIPLEIKNYLWNFTPCITQFGQDKEGYPTEEYFFYIVDYDLPENWLDYDHIVDMRNAGVVKTKYFFEEKDALQFLFDYMQGEV